MPVVADGALDGVAHDVNEPRIRVEALDALFAVADPRPGGVADTRLAGVLDGAGLAEEPQVPVVARFGVGVALAPLVAGACRVRREELWLLPACHEDVRVLVQ